MIQENNRELLMKEICARIPYRTWFKFSYTEPYGHKAYSKSIIEGVSFPYYIEHYTLTGSERLHIERSDIQLYLLPLSSITPEQEKELQELGLGYGEYGFHDDIYGRGIMVDEAYEFYEWCYKNHIDFRGLIERGLAIDATGLGIYD
jgi:hypothetical protein